MDERAFWIDPNGVIMPVMRSHIAAVIADPVLFGVTREYIESVYREYGEALGWEGKAREEIIKRLIIEGWTRIRDYGDYLSVQLFSLHEHDPAARLLSFFRSMSGRYSLETEVRLGILSEGKTRSMRLGDVEQELLTADHEGQLQ